MRRRAFCLLGSERRVLSILGDGSTWCSPVLEPRLGGVKPPSLRAEQTVHVIVLELADKLA